MTETDYFLIYNGQTCFSSNKLITTKNTAFRFGDGLFETMRMFNGRTPLLDEHITRLKKGMQVLGMKHPERYTAAFFNKQIQKLRTKNKIAGGGRVRLMVFRDSTAVFPPQNKVSYLLEVLPAKHEKFHLNKKGWRLGVYGDQQKSTSSLSNYKTNNYLVSVLAKLYAHEQRKDDCCLLNTRGEIIETTTANIFVVIDDKIYTPPLHAGCVDGVMRKQMLSWFDVTEQVLLKKHLHQAEEVFLTNAFAGVRWVKSFGDRTYTANWSKKAAEIMNQEFQS